jgi:hypothetical protein
VQHCGAQGFAVVVQGPVHIQRDDFLH